MSVLQTNAFPLGYSAVTGNKGKMLWRGAIVIVIAGGEMNSNFRPLSISKVKFFSDSSVCTLHQDLRVMS